MRKLRLNMATWLNDKALDAENEVISRLLGWLVSRIERGTNDQA